MNFIRDDFDKNPHSGSLFSSKRTYAVKAGDTQIFSLEQIDKALMALEEDNSAHVLINTCIEENA
jgi:hypothetical protein